MVGGSYYYFYSEAVLKDSFLLAQNFFRFFFHIFNNEDIFEFLYIYEILYLMIDIRKNYL